MLSIVLRYFRYPAVNHRNTARQERVALLLAGTAGFVDVVGYLTLHHLFTAHMTGNTSKLGVALGRGHLGAALPLAVVPFLFAGGIAAGTLLVDGGRRWAALGLQAILIAIYMGYGSTIVHGGTARDRTLTGFYVLAALATVALGLQTAALTEIRGVTVRTSYISGVLTNLAQGGARRFSGRERDRQPLALLLSLCLAYLVGATAGSYTLDEFALWCLAIPLAAVLATAVADLSTGWR
jgi:uncharacterized membrane protein YoaK (UPF0700 family)